MTTNLLMDFKALKDIRVLVVDNDGDSRYLWTVLLESYNAQVKAIGTVKDALSLLDWFIPDILICEIRFLGESVYPLIYQIRDIALSNGKSIPILVTSASPLTILAQHLIVQLEDYLLKPIDLDTLVEVVWNLTRLPQLPLNTKSLKLLDQQIKVQV